jgi:hypothetical protein
LYQLVFKAVKRIVEKCEKYRLQKNSIISYILVIRKQRSKCSMRKRVAASGSQQLF